MKFSSILISILWAISFLGGCFGLLIFFNGLSEADGAPQEAAVGAVSAAITIIPYCIARAISELLRNKLK